MTKILIVNPNRDTDMEAVILANARKCAPRDTEVDAKSVPSAPLFIENYVDEIVAGTGMLELIEKEEANYDAFIIACHSDVNMDALREKTSKPVIGIGQASLHVASMLGHSFSVIQTTRHSVPMKEDMIRQYGLWERCASVRSVPGDDPTVENMIKAAGEAVEEDGAEVIVLGCAGLAGQEGVIQDALGVPVVDGVACAVFLAAGLVRCGLTVSKRRKYNPQ